MDGGSMRAGAVAGLRRCRHAAAAARLVMERTRHTLLAGDQATQFAKEMGLPVGEAMEDEWSRQAHQRWCGGVQGVAGKQGLVGTRGPPAPGIASLPARISSPHSFFWCCLQEGAWLSAKFQAGGQARPFPVVWALPAF